MSPLIPPSNPNSPKKRIPFFILLTKRVKPKSGPRVVIPVHRDKHRWMKNDLREREVKKNLFENKPNKSGWTVVWSQEKMTHPRARLQPEYLRRRGTPTHPRLDPQCFVKLYYLNRIICFGLCLSSVRWDSQKSSCLLFLSLRLDVDFFLVFASCSFCLTFSLGFAERSPLVDTFFSWFDWAVCLEKGNYFP